MHGVLMNVMQPGEVTSLEGDVRLPVVLPKPASSGLTVPAIQFLCAETVQFLDHGAQRCCIWIVRGTVADQVIVIRENRPCFESPSELSGQCDQCFLKPVFHRIRGHEMSFLLRSCREKIHSGVTEPVRRSMRPVARASGTFIIVRMGCVHDSRGKASLDCGSLLSLSVRQPAVGHGCGEASSALRETSPGSTAAIHKSGSRLPQSTAFGPRFPEPVSIFIIAFALTACFPRGRISGRRSIRRDRSRSSWRRKRLGQGRMAPRCSGRCSAECDSCGRWSK